MSFENPENIIRSWNVQSNFAAGPVVADRLVPPQYGRIRTPFVQTWREEAVSSTLDWGANNFSIYLPESLRVVSSMYLRIQLPVANSAYKDYPGLYAIKTIRLLSAGQEVYTCDFFQHMDHIQQRSRISPPRISGTRLPSQPRHVTSCCRSCFSTASKGRDNRGHGVLPWPEPPGDSNHP